MRKRLITILTICAAFLPLSLQARFVNSDIFKIGTFPNGVEYYMVNNSSVKGVVDIALVQKQPGDPQALLDSLDGMGRRSPASYLADKGVAYSSKGYVFREAGATIYRFNDVPVGSTMDSTLFMLTRLTASSPATSTLIMCGDINTSTMIDRMGLLSLSIPVREPAPVDSEYVWKPRPERTVKYINNGKENAAMVIIKFTIPRLPDSARMTAQPVFNRFFAQCLTVLLRERMSTEFKHRDIAFSDLKAVYLDSSASHGDESYTISFRVLADELGPATACAASVMSGIEQFGVQEDEFQRANSKILDFLVDRAKTSVLSNSDYVRQCLNSCLNGASLASVQDIKNYFSERQFSLEQQTYYFNIFAGALLDRSKNASFTFLSAIDPDVDAMMERFDQGWNYPVGFDTPAIPEFSSVIPKMHAPVRIRREVTDDISGGTMWKFSNGMKVIFKRTSGGDMMDYYLVIRGGVQNVPNPGPGETAFVQDMFNMFGISSMSHSDFDMMLASKGISLKTFADYNGLTVNGKIPNSELAYLPTILSELRDLTPPSASEMEYYRKCVKTTDEYPLQMLNYRIDQLLRPDDKQLEYKFSRNITDSTAIKAMQYYKTQFSKMNDGVLLIFGDMHPETVCRILFRSLGAMPTKRRPAPQKWSERPQISSGVNMIMDSTAILDLNSARIRIKVAEPVSRESNFAFILATMCLKETMESILHERGFFVKSNVNYSLYPEDTYTATFDVIPCPEDGLPKHIGKPSSVLDALADLHTGLKSGEDLSVARLDLYKTILTSRLAVELSDEKKLIAYSLLRYSAGKNMTGDYKSQINAVSADKVRETVTKILNAGRVEYIVR